MISVVAIQRLYEGQRRAVINMRPENSERFQTNELKKKYRARRERVGFSGYINFMHGALSQLYARRSKLSHRNYGRSGKSLTFIICPRRRWENFSEETFMAF